MDMCDGDSLHEDSFRNSIENVMRLSVIWHCVLIIVSQFVYVGARQYSLSNFTTSFLERLNSAEGDERAIRFLKVLAIIDKETMSSLHTVDDIIEAVEEIIVISNERASVSTLDLYEFKTRFDELAQLNRNLQDFLRSLHWEMPLYGKTLRKTVDSFIAFEFETLKDIKHHLILADPPVQDLNFVKDRLSSCKNGLLAGFKAAHILQNFDKKVVHQYILDSFKTVDRADVAGEDSTFAISYHEEKDNIQRASDFKYLRENFLVLAKSGIFLLFCAAIKVYTCAFAFGALIISSSVLWILIYLQLMELEI